MAVDRLVGADRLVEVDRLVEAGRLVEVDGLVEADRFGDEPMAESEEGVDVLSSIQCTYKVLLAKEGARIEWLTLWLE